MLNRLRTFNVGTELMCRLVGAFHIGLLRPDPVTLMGESMRGAGEESRPLLRSRVVLRDVNVIPLSWVMLEL